MLVLIGSRDTGLAGEAAVAVGYLGKVELGSNWEAETQLCPVVQKRDHRKNCRRDGNWKSGNFELLPWQGTKMSGCRCRMRVCVLLCSGRSTFCGIGEHLFLGWTSRWRGAAKCWVLQAYSRVVWVIKPLGIIGFFGFGEMWNKRIHASKNNVSKVGSGCGNVRSKPARIPRIGSCEVVGNISFRWTEARDCVPWEGWRVLTVVGDGGCDGTIMWCAMEMKNRNICLERTH